MTTTVVDPWYRALPGVTSAVGALVLRRSNEVLLAQPVYKRDWVLVGGTVDEGEPPAAALQREIREELGPIAGGQLEVGRLRVTDWVAPRAGWDRPMIHLVFDCVLDAAAPDRLVSAMELAEELRSVEFVPVERAVRLLAAHEARRLEVALLARRTDSHFYLESGHEPDTTRRKTDR